MRKIILPFLILLFLYSNAFAEAEIFLAAKKGSLPFISTWNTSLTSSGSSAVKNIKLPLTSNITGYFNSNRRMDSDRRGNTLIRIDAADERR